MINLSDREKNLLIVLIITVIISFGYYFIFTPIIEYKENSEASFDSNRLKITTLDNTYSEYKTIIEEKRKLDALASKSNIVSMTNEIASDLNIRININYKTTNSNIVQNDIEKTTTEIRVEGVTINALLQLIDRIENLNLPMNVQKVVITSGFQDRDRYDSLIVIVSLNKK